MIQCWFWLFLLLFGVPYGKSLILQSTRLNEVCGIATFTCIHGGIDSVNWVIRNDSFFQEMNSTLASIWNVQIENSDIDASVTVLKLLDLNLDHNNMFRITCEANEMQGTQPLQVQDINLTLAIQERDSVVLLNWTFTSRQQFTYCVEVQNTSEVLDTVCGQNETEFSYDRNWCDRITFRVILMKSNCTGAESAVNYTDSRASSPPVIQSIPASLSDRRMLIMSAPVCMHGGLRFVDVDTGQTITLELDAEVTITETNITFSTQQLRENRLYNASVTATNAAGNSTSSNILSTHNIANVTAVVGSPNGLTLQTSYTDAAASGGVLLALLHTRGGFVDFSKSTYLALSVNSSVNHNLSRTTIPSGEFRVLAYGVSSEGNLGMGVVFPAVDIATNFSTDGRVMAFKNVTQCDVSAMPQEITVNCKNLTGYQVLVQSTNSSEVRGLKVNKTTNRQAPVSVEVGETGMYHVAVFLVTPERGIVGSELVYSSDVIEISGASQSRAHVGIVASVMAAVLISFHQ